MEFYVWHQSWFQDRETTTTTTTTLMDSRSTAYSKLWELVCEIELQGSEGIDAGVLASLLQSNLFTWSTSSYGWLGSDIFQSWGSSVLGGKEATWQSIATVGALDFTLVIFDPTHCVIYTFVPVFISVQWIWNGGMLQSIPGHEQTIVPLKFLFQFLAVSLLIYQHNQSL